MTILELLETADYYFDGVDVFEQGNLNSFTFVYDALEVYGGEAVLQWRPIAGVDEYGDSEVRIEINI